MELHCVQIYIEKLKINLVNCDASPHVHQLGEVRVPGLLDHYVCTAVTKLPIRKLRFYKNGKNSRKKFKKYGYYAGIIGSKPSASPCSDLDNRAAQSYLSSEKEAKVKFLFGMYTLSLTK